MKTITLRLPFAIFICLGAVSHAFAQAAPNNKEFDDYTQVQRDAAKAAARTAHYTSFRVCADPGDMPFSNIKEEGFENKIANVIAKALGTTATYFWRPYIERGLTRQTFDTNDCDILMDVPYNYESALTTFPIYGSTYVLASRSSDNYNFSGLSDPLLHKLQIGVYELSSLRQSLANHGVVSNVHVHEVSHDGDLVESHQPWWQVKEVVDGKLDVAGVWGPFAGWVKAQGAPLKLQPTNLMDDIIPMEFEMAIGVRKTDAVRKYAIENALNKHRDEIKKILDDYGVPLIECSDCLISGTIKAHGIYSAPTISAEELAKLHREKPEVTRERLETWLKDGADVNVELADAVLASDNERIGFLLEKGADINKKDLQGYTPLTASVRLGSLDTSKYLLERGARVDIPDSDGWLPLLHAVLRNDVAAIQLLLSKGTNVDSTAPGGFTALAVAIEEKKFDAAKALINSGAKVDLPVSKKKLTPLMAAASEPPPESRINKLQQTLNSMDIARELLSHGANVNAISSEGVTPLMIAAAHDNAPMIGLLLQSGAQPGMKSADGETARQIAAKAENGSAIRALDLFAETAPK
ncbi:quinoprotein dehydrogenase-associated putative ABC transporter substrate-binding protein [Methyloferula stellata]|uniref:quinoprotein dehydrogenase-associated putative ABC transporter substrate-binding protein n=1 Tax=Methyloferula stellata TaxID=876270 RepID=UPI00036A2DD5|nr:quinoprotein dehydrogenase-associated putative ABC transporter substrate-binding protein [Methyloferula stellata]